LTTAPPGRHNITLSELRTRGQLGWSHDLDHATSVTIEQIADLFGHRTTIVTRKVLRDRG
jgi:hypothetical protein